MRSARQRRRELAVIHAIVQLVAEAGVADAASYTRTAVEILERMPELRRDPRKWWRP